jgi:hypoxanthine-DNA glycosylase
MDTEKTAYSRNVRHPFPPVIDGQAETLVLGSFPSVKSRENMFYYGHPQNRFWMILASLFCQAVPETIGDKTALLHRNHIALWDVVAACDILGSADGSLTPLQFNDIQSLVQGTQIKRVFANGRKAGALYCAHWDCRIGIPFQILPSTSPANAAWPLDRLIAAWEPLRNAVCSREKMQQHL